MKDISATVGSTTANKKENNRSSNTEQVKLTPRTLNSYKSRLSDIMDLLVNLRILLSFLSL